MKWKRDLLFMAVMLISIGGWAQTGLDNSSSGDRFPLSDCAFISQHRGLRESNAYMVLLPGWQLILEGEKGGAARRLERVVLDQTETIAGVTTRVVRDREWINDDLQSVSMNYFAICSQSGDIYCFGGDSADYQKGEIVAQQRWRAGVAGAVLGLEMPGNPSVGDRIQRGQGYDRDRFEVKGFTSFNIGGGTCANVLILAEAAPDKQKRFSNELYAPGIGMVKGHDDTALVAWGINLKESRANH